MTGYERIHAALKGQRADKVPITLHNFMMAAAEAGYTQHEYRESSEIIADTFKRAVDKYNYDGILLDIDTATLAGSVGVKIDFPEHECARCISGNINDFSDIDGLTEPNILNYKYINIWLEAARKLKDYFHGDISIRGNCDQAPFTLASMMRGAQKWMMDLMDEDNKDRIHKLLEYCTKATNQFIKAMSETGADIISNGDSVAGPAMISPSMYEEFALPYEKQVIKTSHQLNLPYVLHICGNTDPILKLMKETGADALELDYLTNVNYIYSLLSNSVTFFGNIDPSGVLAYGTYEEVEEKTLDLLDLYGNNDRFVLNSGCAIPSNTPSENITKMIETARRYR